MASGTRRLPARALVLAAFPVLAGCPAAPAGLTRLAADPPDLSFAPSSRDSIPSESLSASLRNAGDLDLRIDALALEGADAGDFELRGEIPEPPLSFPRGATLSLSVGLRSPLLRQPGGPGAADPSSLQALVYVHARVVEGAVAGAGGSVPAAYGPRGTWIELPLRATLHCDFDGDGDRALRCGGGDCDDSDPTRGPSRLELCDEIDQDCDGLPEPADDQDGDASLFCDDCDDGDAASAPGAVELCDGRDNDCNGVADADPMGEADGDSDGSLSCADCDDGDAANTPGDPELCDGQDNDRNGIADADADGEVDADGDDSLSCADCDDLDPGNAPAAPELCDGRDNDCDGSANADPAGEIDADSDGSLSCADCDDANPANTPGALEQCDGADNDCDGLAGADPLGEADSDADGWLSCLDCDDGNAAVFPGAEEQCNAMDDDCSGAPDFDVAGEADADADGWLSCEECDDGRALTFPGAPETCNGLDDDCDGDTDEDSLRVPEDQPTVQAGLTFAQDGDVVCVAPGTYVENIEFGGVSAHVLGWGGPELTVLDGGGLDTVVRIDDGEGPGTTLESFTVRGGMGQTFVDAGGISVEYASASLVDLLVTDNEGIVAGGMYSIGADLTVLAVSFTENAASSGAGGLVASDSEIVADGLALLGNTGGIGGAGFSQFSLVSIENLLVAGNSGTSTRGGGAGGLSVYASTLAINGAVFASNNAAVGGGALVVGSGPVSMVNVALTGNTAASHGGAVLAVAGALDATHCAFVANYAVRGAAVYGYSSDLSFVGSDFSGNVAGASGAVWYEPNLAPSIWSASWSNFWDNSPFPFGALPSPVGANGNIAVPPEYSDTASPDALDWDLHLSTTSGLVDAGDPGSLDPDGSPSDIGRFSGAGASAMDLDWDTAPSWWQPGPYDFTNYAAQGWDCDDLDPAVGPEEGCGP